MTALEGKTESTERVWLGVHVVTLLVLSLVLNIVLLVRMALAGR